MKSKICFLIHEWFNLSISISTEYRYFIYLFYIFLIYLYFLFMKIWSLETIRFLHSFLKMRTSVVIWRPYASSTILDIAIFTKTNSHTCINFILPWSLDVLVKHWEEVGEENKAQAETCERFGERELVFGRSYSEGVWVVCLAIVRFKGRTACSFWPAYKMTRSRYRNEWGHGVFTI